MEMVEREGIRVDWFEKRGGGDVEEREGMEVEVGRRRGGEEWRRNGEESDEGEDGRRKRRRGMMVRGKDEQDDENAEDGMLELTLSLAVAISVPSPHPKPSPAAGKFVLHQHQHQHNELHRHHNNNSNNHQHHQQQHQHQQLAAMVGVGGRNESPVKQLLQRPSSPLVENHRGSSRANLTASLKHLVSQQQPVKVKTVPRMMPGGLPLHYEASPAPQLPRTLLEGQQEAAGTGMLFQGMPSLPGPLSLAGQRAQSGHLNLTHQSMFPKGFPHQSQLRPSANQRIYSRSPSLGLLHQLPLPQPELATHQGQHGPLGQGTSVPSTALSRIFATAPSASSIASQAPSPSLPVTGPQLQAFLQHQASSAVSVASHRQAHPASPAQAGVSALGKTPSAFSVVRPSVSGTVPSSLGEIPPRDRAGDGHVIVNICDRKVKLTSEVDATSLYALCRRWVRNDVLRRDQSVSWDGLPLQRPLSAAAVAETNKPESVVNTKKEEAAEVDETKVLGSIELLTGKELLQHHVEHFKGIRKRFRDDRMQRIARFMPRLAMLLPGNVEIVRHDALSDQPQP